MAGGISPLDGPMSPGGAAGAEMCDEDGCKPSYTIERVTLLSSLPFIITFVTIAVLSMRRLFPYLSNSLRHARQLSATHSKYTAFLFCGYAQYNSYNIYRRLAAIVFTVTLAAAGVLAQLILCEISNFGNKKTRGAWFGWIIDLLLFLLIVVTPLLAVHLIVKGSEDQASASPSSVGSKPGRLSRLVRSRKWTIFIELCLFSSWIWVFYKIGNHVPIPPMTDVITSEQTVSEQSKALSDECLSRIGVIGVVLMGLLSGFGSISAIWHSFISKRKPVTENDLNRIQAGLSATKDSLETNRSKLRLLEKKIQDKAPQDGFVKKMFSSIKGDSDMQEATALRMEISGLETMYNSLSRDLDTLSARWSDQRLAQTTTGRAYLFIQLAFSVYCVYRLGSTLLVRLPLRASSGNTFSQSDPISNILALFAARNPQIDREAWSRYIGFAFSGFIIVGSVNASITTFSMLTKAAPGVWGHVGLALAVSQLTATFIVSSAVLLRNSLPKDMGSVLGKTLGVLIDVAWIDRLFDSVYISGAGITLICLLIVRKYRDVLETDLDDDLLERGEKRS